jgi:AcrR family transcriptional regulator
MDSRGTCSDRNPLDAHPAVVSHLGRKLKPGPGLDPGLVAESQKYRLRKSMVELVATEGYERVTVRELSVRAQVSTRSFYNHYENLDECFLSTHDSVICEALNQARASEAEAGPGPLDQLWAIVHALLRSLSSDPRAARLALIDVFALGPGANPHIIEATAELESLLASALSGLPKPTTATPHLVAGIVAGATRVLRKTTSAGRAADLPGMTEELVDWMLSLAQPELRALAATPSGRSIPAWVDPDLSPSGGRSEAVGGDDRSKILHATVELAGSDGYASLTASRISDQAGVSRRAFMLCFRDVRQCFLDAIDAMIASRARSAHGWALEDADQWESRTYKTVLALCAWSARDAALARLIFIETFAAGTTGLLKREDLLGRAAASFRRTIPPRHAPSELAAEASVAAAWHIACGDVASGGARRLHALAPLLTFLLLAPVIGAPQASSHIRTQSTSPEPWARAPSFIARSPAVINEQSFLFD